MTPTPHLPPEDVNVAAVRENLTLIHVIAKNEGFTNIEGFADKGKAALDRLAARLQEAERDARDFYNVTCVYEDKIKAAEAREAALREAAERIKDYEANDVGGNEWWEAHAKLYAALATTDPEATE